VEKAQAKVLHDFLDMLSFSIANFATEKREMEVMRSHTSTPSLEECVADSLSYRQKASIMLLLRGLGFPEEKIEQTANDIEQGNKLNILGRALTDDKFRKLASMGMKLIGAQAFSEKLDEARNAADKAMKPETPITPERRKKIFACAKEVRMPVGWKPSQAGKDGNPSLEDVLSVNLAALRTALATEKLTPGELAYYARIFAAATEKAELLKFVRTNQYEVNELSAQISQSVAQGNKSADSDVGALLEELVKISREDQ